MAGKKNKSKMIFSLKKKGRKIFWLSGSWTFSGKKQLFFSEISKNKKNTMWPVNFFRKIKKTVPSVGKGVFFTYWEKEKVALFKGESGD